MLALVEGRHATGENVMVLSVTIPLRPVVKVQEVWNNILKMIGYVTLLTLYTTSYNMLCRVLVPLVHLKRSPRAVNRLPLLMNTPQPKRAIF
jgi:hypothetical protein